MSVVEAVGMELNELGLIAVIATMLVPTYLWVARAKTPGQMMQRTALSAGVVLGAAVVNRMRHER